MALFENKKKNDFGKKNTDCIHYGSNFPFKM